MNLGYLFFQIIILFIIYGTTLFFLNVEFLNVSKFLDLGFGEKNNKFIIFSLITTIEYIIIMVLISSFYQIPIKRLEYAIKSFLVGKYNKKNFPAKSFNRSLNYCLKFFGKTLTTLQNIKGEFMHGRAIKGEVFLAKEIQEKMLTKEIINIPSFEMIFKSKPAGEIGGDSFDVIKQNDNYYIYVGDATGHGVGAGLIMTMVNALVSGFSKVYESGADVLSKTNEILKPRIKPNLLMSLLLVRWNEKEKRLFMTGAGHEYLMIYKQKENKTYKIKSKGVALGMIKDISKIMKEVEINLKSGDILVLYSDGITEAINKPKRDGNELLFGEDRLVETIQNSPNVEGKPYKSARSVFNNITISLSKFMGYNFNQLDDITLGVIQYKTPDFDKKFDYKESIDNELITEWNW